MKLAANLHDAETNTGVVSDVIVLVIVRGVQPTVEFLLAAKRVLDSAAMVVSLSSFRPTHVAVDAELADVPMPITNPGCTFTLTLGPFVMSVAVA